MKKKPFPLSEGYRLLEPGPVVLLTTTRDGRPNVMPRSWHLMMELTPTLVGCVVSNRNYSFASLKASRECVINIPTQSNWQNPWWQSSKPGLIQHKRNP